MGLLTQLSGHWWAWMGPMLWQSTLLVVVVSAIDFLIRRWAWPQVRYVLWLLVMVKLLLPPVWSSPTGVVPQIERQLTARVELPWVPVAREAVTPTSPQRPPNVVGVVTPTDEGSTAATEARRPVQPAKPAMDWKVYAFAVWLVGVLGFVALLAARYAALRRWHDRERHGQTIPPWYYDLLVKTAQRLGTGRLPAIVFSDRLLTPAVCGVMRPVMYLPRDYTEKLTPAEAEHVLLHEMAHLKRGDLWLHALGLFVQVVYWFHPFVALACKHMQHVCEICTDLTVAEVLRERTVGYRQTLLDTARRMLTESASPGLGLLGVFEEPFRLVARLRWLEKPTWHHRKAARATAAVAAVAMLAFVLPMAGGSLLPSNTAGGSETGALVVGVGPAAGTIAIATEPSGFDAPWQMTGPNGFTLSDHGDTTLVNMNVGDYTLTWGAMAGLFTPAGQNQPLVAGGMVSFTGRYVSTISDDFNTDSDLWTYHGSAYRRDEGYRVDLVVLTEPSWLQVGQIRLRQGIVTPFNVNFRFRVGGVMQPAADGMIFMFYKDLDYVPAPGECLGFGDGISNCNVPGYGIEFRRCAAESHFALVEGSPKNHLAYADDPRPGDYKWHDVRVEVGQAAVRLLVDGDEVLTWQGTLDRTHAGFGFSGATGDFTNWHMIDDVTVEAVDPYNSALTSR